VKGALVCGCPPRLFVLAGDFRVALPASVDFSSLHPFSTISLPRDPGVTLVAVSKVEEESMVLHVLGAADDELVCNAVEDGFFESIVLLFVPTGSRKSNTCLCLCGTGALVRGSPPRLPFLVGEFRDDCFNCLAAPEEITVRNLSSSGSVVCIVYCE
jgi:hypothetical protein